MSTPAKIRLDGVAKSFGAKHVLRGVDLEVSQGESVVIIGGSGTGKSVTVKCILGLIEPDAGRIAIDGEDTTHLPSRERRELMRRMGMLFQGGALFDSLTVADNVAFPLVHGRGQHRAKARQQAIDSLALVGLDADVAALRPAELSGGMQKRVALARAIISRPEMIFFDEPTTGLDPIMADVINELIVDCVRKLGATALTITHDMASARKIADRIAMLHEGRIIWEGPVAQLDRCPDPRVDQFVQGHAEGPIRMPVRAL